MKKILIVDDNIEFNEILKTFLEIEGYIVDQAHSGKEAFKKSIKNCYNLILTDLNMPQMSGEEFIKSLFEINPTIPVFIISGNLKCIDELLKKYRNVKNIFEKPVDLIKIKKEINNFFKNPV